MKPRSRLRAGLTLYEIVLALSILLVAMAVLSDLIATGTRAGTQARLRTDGMLLCQTKMAEVIAGVEPMAAVRNAPIDTNPGWTWSLEVLAGPHADLMLLRVTAAHEATSSTYRDRRVDASVSLERCIRNPYVYEEAAAQLEAEAQEASSSSTSGTSR